MSNQPFTSERGRSWKRTRYKHEGDWVAGHKIFCSTVGCTSARLMIDRHDKQIPPEQVERRFKQFGWLVGKKSMHDLCPDCVQKKEDDRRAKGKHYPASAKAAALGGPGLHLVVTNDEPKGEPVKPAIEDEPKKMTPADNRIIYDKLSETYNIDKQCYHTPWTDHAVAHNLGCPVAWVIEVRKPFFGEARDNGEIRDLLTAIQTNKTAMEKLITTAEVLDADAKSIAGRITNTRAAIESATRTLEILLKRAEQIVKATGQS